uniref:Uncharacterized protein n=1 Tax=Setaria viridis TaxID=4556 RepID=A0A4U6VQF0_SETVI|nr:hypothetical protein SEVIR_2G146450v2 [Setaria viridis]
MVGGGGIVVERARGRRNCGEAEKPESIGTRGRGSGRGDGCGMRGGLAQQRQKLYHGGDGAPWRGRRGCERDEARQKGLQGLPLRLGGRRADPSCRGRRLGEAARVGKIEPHGGEALKRGARWLWRVCLERIGKNLLWVHHSVSGSPQLQDFEGTLSLGLRGKPAVWLGFRGRG